MHTVLKWFCATSIAFLLPKQEICAYCPEGPINFWCNEQNDKFSVFSINAQSLYAKFDQILAVITDLENNGFRFSALCVQETWLDEHSDTSLLQIPGYSLINCGRVCSAHGGLAIYLHEKYTFHICDLFKKSDIWEGLFIEVNGNGLEKSVTLGNIYRPPRFNNNNETVRNFLSEIGPIITKLGHKNQTAILTGDYNLNLLDIDTREAYQEYTYS